MISPLLLQNCCPFIFNGRGNKELGRKHVNKWIKIINPPPPKKTPPNKQVLNSFSIKMLECLFFSV